MTRLLPADHASRRRLAFVVVLFAASRVVYFAAGLRFDTAGLDYSSQLADPEWLREDPLGTVWHMHSQPPLFNLVVGSVLRWSPLPDDVSLQIVYLVSGAMLAVGSFCLAREFGLSPAASTGVSALVSCNPTSALYETWVAYEQPVAVMLVWTALFGAKWLRSGKTSSLFGLSLTGAAATLTRSMMHPVWLVAVLVLAVSIRRPRTPRSWAAAVAPLLVVAVFLVKNVVLFSVPSLSSWFGFNLYKVAVAPLREQARQQLQAAGVVEDRPAPLECTLEHPNVPVLSSAYKTGWRASEEIRNWNHECLLPWFEALERESVEVIRRKPFEFVRAVVGSFEIWAGPATYYPGVARNRSTIDRLETLWTRVAMVGLPWKPPLEVPGAWGVAVSAPRWGLYLSLTIVCATAVVVGAGAGALVRLLRGCAGSRSRSLLVGAFTVAYVTLAANLFEHGENNRIRYVAEPLTLTIAASICLLLVAFRRPEWGLAERNPDAQPTGEAVDQPPEPQRRRRSGIGA
ncbi:MAG: hypothetical protein KatS3mg008_0475 [Acidimicrobiales bacterium]|nr:MAG: hypothetical protein KatS3mg008_0475 [Acidimicrobiales bacterium]